MDPWVWALFGAIACGLAGVSVPGLIAAARALKAGAALACGGLGAVLGWYLAGTTHLIVWWPLVPIGVALAVVDWRARRLPTRVIAPSYALGGVAVLLGCAIGRDVDDLLRSVWGWAIAGGLFLLLWVVYPRGMGYGDVRLSGVLGIALGNVGWPALVTGLYAGFVLGAVVGGVLSLARVVDRKGYPFGPFMLVGSVVGIVLSQVLAGLAAA